MVGTKFTKSIIILRDNIINLMTKACWEQTRTTTATLQEEQREQKMNGEERKRQIKRQRKRNNIEVRRQIIRGTERWPEKTGRVVLQGTGLIHWRWCSCLVFQESRNSNMQFFFWRKDLTDYSALPAVITITTMAKAAIIGCNSTCNTIDI